MIKIDKNSIRNTIPVGNTTFYHSNDFLESNNALSYSKISKGLIFKLFSLLNKFQVNYVIKPRKNGSFVISIVNPSLKKRTKSSTTNILLVYVRKEFIRLKMDLLLPKDETFYSTKHFDNVFSEKLLVIINKAIKEEKQQLTLYLPKSLHQKLDNQALKEQIKISDLIINILSKDLSPFYSQEHFENFYKYINKLYIPKASEDRTLRFIAVIYIFASDDTFTQYFSINNSKNFKETSKNPDITSLDKLNYHMLGSLIFLLQLKLSNYRKAIFSDEISKAVKNYKSEKDKFIIKNSVKILTGLINLI